MKVHELIENLKELPQNYEVIMVGGYEISSFQIIDNLCGHDKAVLMVDGIIEKPTLQN